MADLRIQDLDLYARSGLTLDAITEFDTELVDSDWSLSERTATEILKAASIFLIEFGFQNFIEVWVRIAYDLADPDLLGNLSPTGPYTRSKEFIAAFFALKKYLPAPKLWLRLYTDLKNWDSDMARGKANKSKTKASKEVAKTNDFFNQDLEGPAPCAHTTCGYHSHLQKMGISEGAAETAAAHEVFDKALNQFERMYPEVTEALLTEAKSINAADKGHCLGLLAHKLEKRMLAGEDPRIDLVMQALTVYFKKHDPKHYPYVLDDTRGATANFEPGATGMKVACAVGIIEKAIDEAKDKALEVLHKAIDEQYAIMDDLSKPPFDRNIAKMEHIRLRAESQNVLMRAGITQARLITLDKSYGCNPEAYANLLIDSLKLPGGGKEDPAGVLKSLEATGVSKACQVGKLPMSMRQILEEPTSLVTDPELSAKLGMMALKSKAAESTIKDAGSVATEVAGINTQRKKHRNKIKKDAKGKAPSNEAATSTIDIDSAASATAAQAGGSCNIICNSTGFKESLAEKKARIDAMIEEREILLKAHEKNLLGLENEAKKTFGSDIGDESKPLTLEEMIASTGASQSLSFMPPSFHFQQVLIPKRIHKPIKQALWDLDFALEEIKREGQELSEITTKIQSNILIWFTATLEGKNTRHWEKVKATFFEIPSVREYCAKRPTWAVDCANAGFLNSKVVNYFTQSEHGVELFKQNPEFKAAVLRFGKSAHEVNMYWDKMGKKYVEDPKAQFIGDVDPLIALAKMKLAEDDEAAHQAAKAQTGK